MSHFTKMRTTLTDGDVLERSLRDLGHQIERGQVSVRGYRGQRTPVELRVPTKSSGYDIGFRHSSPVKPLAVAPVEAAALGLAWILGRRA